MQIIINIKVSSTEMNCKKIDFKYKFIWQLKQKK